MNTLLIFEWKITTIKRYCTTVQRSLHPRFGSRVICKTEMKYERTRVLVKKNETKSLYYRSFYRWFFFFFLTNSILKFSNSNMYLKQSSNHIFRKISVLYFFFHYSSPCFSFYTYSHDCLVFTRNPALLLSPARRAFNEQRVCRAAAFVRVKRVFVEPQR